MNEANEADEKPTLEYEVPEAPGEPETIGRSLSDFRHQPITHVTGVIVILLIVLLLIMLA